MATGDIDLKVQALSKLASPYFDGNHEVLMAVRRVLLREHSDYRSYKVRAAAARTLGAIGGDGAISALQLGLEDEHERVQIAAIEQLAALVGAGMRDRFVALLEDDSASVRMTCLEKLAQITTPAVDRPYVEIIERLADREDSVRDVARRVLSQSGEFAVPPLIDALGDTNSTIRGAVADLLGESGDERARNPLRKVATNDDSSWVKSRADMALDTLPKEQFVQPKVKRDVPEAGTLGTMRSEAPKWSRHGASENMTIEQIQAMLDSLDLRLMNGEISEALYQKLLVRWQARLNEIKGGDA